MYDVCTHVIPSIIKLQTVLYRIKKIQDKFNNKYTKFNNTTCP